MLKFAVPMDGPHTKCSLCNTSLCIVVTPPFCITQCLDCFPPNFKECIPERLGVALCAGCLVAAGVIVKFLCAGLQTSGSYKLLFAGLQTSGRSKPRNPVLRPAVQWHALSILFSVLINVVISFSLSLRSSANFLSISAIFSSIFQSKSSRLSFTFCSLAVQLESTATLLSISSRSSAAF